VVSGAFVSLPLGIFCSPISEHYMHEFFGSHVFASFILWYNAGIIYVYEVITKPTDLWTEDDYVLFYKYCPSMRDRCWHAISRDAGCGPQNY
jgi:hypothetical protein